MPRTVIRVDNLYKEYRLGVIGHGTLYRDLQSFWAKINGRDDPNSLIGAAKDAVLSDQILALNNFSLDIKDGEVLGIIGANGAGKSTFLKILSRVTAPTSGSIRVKGRTASLLEVGTGFHPELTGRENIYLNGAINGLNRKEVSARLDEIVEFASVGKFLDTPVKRYSSGMHVRLGFAVAAHLDPDILIVDEVLAVGDALFRKKAVEKMKSISESGSRTVIFVSHNMESVKLLCSRVILLKDGVSIMDGSPDEVISDYLSSVSKSVAMYSGERTWPLAGAPGNNVVRLSAIRVKDTTGKVCFQFDVTETINLEVEYVVLKQGYQFCVGVQFHNDGGVWLFFAPDSYVGGTWGKQTPKSVGIHRAIYRIPGNLLNEGLVLLDVAIFSPPAEPTHVSTYVDEHQIFSFEVNDFFNSNSSRGSYPFHWGSPALRPKIESETVYLGEKPL